MSNSQDEKKMNPAVWDIEKTHPELVKSVKKKMREVTDPELGLDVVALGLVRNITLNDDRAMVNIILTTPFCPYGPALIEMMKQKAEQALNVPVDIDFGLEMWDFSMMEEDAMPEWGMW